LLESRTCVYRTDVVPYIVAEGVEGAQAEVILSSEQVYIRQGGSGIVVEEAGRVHAEVVLDLVPTKCM